MGKAHHNKSAVKVKTYSTSFCQHETGSAISMLQYSYDEEENVEEGVQAEEEQLSAVVVPVCSGQITRRLPLCPVCIRRLQPVSSTMETQTT